jgi:hypothetical protein
MLDVGKLLPLEENLRLILNERLEEILCNLNRSGELDTFLKLLGLTHLLGEVVNDERPRDGIIIVIGQSKTNIDDLIGGAKQFGFHKDRFEFHLDYEDGKTFNFGKTQYSTKYSCILVGPMPHSGVSKGEYGSVIAALRPEDGYPPVYRLGADKLKITRSSFLRTLEDLINQGILVA